MKGRSDGRQEGRNGGTTERRTDGRNERRKEDDDDLLHHHRQHGTFQHASIQFNTLASVEQTPSACHSGWRRSLSTTNQPTTQPHRLPILNNSQLTTQCPSFNRSALHLYLGFWLALDGLNYFKNAVLYCGFILRPVKME